ncbi:NUDIX domain-containing protein [Streptomyces luteolus]|uniref:NUDIX hydrolase n=1 Tax=Streptomyces luteolus TaxID=3043615 RepID=A0ABT6T2B3_9ACTN|nr:NUDIX hydrolase [Streptomyces sp. B-S-A12]MDI3422010.1 NUDIX hydrolase [Streptomyces sp. B-S-A12]
MDEQEATTPDAAGLGPWARHRRTPLYATPRLTAYRDEVTFPDGSTGPYNWVRVPDQVRVAALVDGALLVCEQHHYLTGVMWQLPGGSVDPADGDSATAARRELAEETGYRDGHWTDLGTLHPLPGAAPARVHLWSTVDPDPYPAAPEPVEADLKIHHIPLAEAVSAVRDGRLRCAASAALVLAVALGEGRRS